MYVFSFAISFCITSFFENLFCMASFLSKITCYFLSSIFSFPSLTTLLKSPRHVVTYLTLYNFGQQHFSFFVWFILWNSLNSLRHQIITSQISKLISLKGQELAGFSLKQQSPLLILALYYFSTFVSKDHILLCDASLEIFKSYHVFRLDYYEQSTQLF